MSKINAILTDFTGGEISLKCMGRVDLSRYAHAAELVRNFTISPQGGAIRRSGSRFVSSVPNAVNFTRLIEFRFSTTDAVVIELSNLLIRFYKNQGIVLNSGTPYSIVSPYASTDLPNIKFTQSSSIIYLFNQNFPTQVLSRFGDTNWTIVNIPLVDGPYLDTYGLDGINSAPRSTTMTLSGFSSPNPGSTGTLTASTNVFKSTDVGRHVRVYDGALNQSSTIVAWYFITAYTSATAVSVTVGDTSPAGSGSQKSTFSNGVYVFWNLGAISSTTGFPAVGCFFQQRLVMANTPAQPATFFMSQSGDFYYFAPSLYDTTVTDACSIVYTISANTVNSILWFSPSSVLLVGTDGAEWQVSSSNITSAPVTPTNINVALQTGNGSQGSSRAVRVGWETLFVARSGRDVFNLVYEFQVNGFQAKSLSLLGEQIGREGVQLTDMAYQQFPHSVLWFPRQSDGRLGGLTYLAEQDVIGWHLHTIAGAFGSSNAVVESIAVIPTPDGTKDQLWMVVKRTINGATTRYVEFMESPFDNSDTPTTLMCFADSATSYAGSPTTSISGLSYLQGQTVCILADGSVLPQQVVPSSGTITLPKAASNVTIGLPFESLIKILRLDGGGSAGTAQGKKKRSNKFTARFFETIGFEWSVDGENWTQVDFREAQDPMGSAPPLLTGDMINAIDMPVEIEGQFWLRQTQPYPMTLLALMPETMVNQ